MFYLTFTVKEYNSEYESIFWNAEQFYLSNEKEYSLSFYTQSELDYAIKLVQNDNNIIVYNVH